MYVLDVEASAHDEQSFVTGWEIHLWSSFWKKKFHPKRQKKFSSKKKIWKCGWKIIIENFKNGIIKKLKIEN